MKLLAEVTDLEAKTGVDSFQLEDVYRIRKSARAILLNQDGLVATQYLRTYDYHKLPGGGVDQGETIEEALKREIKEEVGCACNILVPIGIVIEYRAKHEMLHVSYCYSAMVDGEIEATALEAQEIEEGQETQWISIEELERLLKTERPEKYTGKFIRLRELAFVREYVHSLLSRA